MSYERPSSHSLRHEPIQAELAPVLDGIRPPELNLHIAYVIPIRGEVSNGNFFKQIRNFTNQRRADKNSFEVLYVRNNPDNNFEIHDRFEPENQTVFEAVQFIQGARDELPDQLEAWQADILTRAKQNRLRVQTLDIKTSTLVGRDDFGDYIDGSRVVGENLAVERFRMLGRNGAVVTLDADTRIGAETTAQVREQLLDDPHVDILRISYDYQRTPGEGDNRLFHTSPAHRYGKMMENINYAVRGRERSGWYAVKSESLGTRTTIGYKLAGRRDLLLQNNNVKQSHGIHMAVQDRARDFGVGGGYGSIRKKGLVSIYAEPEVDELNKVHPAFLLLPQIYERYKGNERIREVTVGLLEKYFAQFSWLLPVRARAEIGGRIMDDLLVRRHNLPDLTPDQVASVTYDLVAALSGERREELERIVSERVQVEAEHHEVHRAAIQRALERAFQLPGDHNFTVEDLQAEPGQTEEAHFIRMNPWLIKEIQDRRVGYSPQTAMGVLIEKYPEYCQPFSETHFMKANAILAGVNAFVEAHKDAFAA